MDITPKLFKSLQMFLKEVSIFGLLLFQYSSMTYPPLSNLPGCYCSLITPSVRNSLPISLAVLIFKVISIPYIPGAPPIFPSTKRKQSCSDFKPVPVLFPLATSY